MPTLNRILLPVDFSERSAGAARYARSLAHHFQSEVIALHVLTPPHYEFGALEIGGSMLTELYMNRSAQVATELKAFVDAELADVRSRHLVLEGDPAGKIVEFAHNEAVDLVLMPTHGYGPFRRFILGSNTAKVLHDADCPVWTGVHLEDAAVTADLPLRSILCGLDLGPQSAKALAWAAWLQQSFSAQLTVIHATPGAVDCGDEAEAHWRVDVREAAEEELLRLQQQSGAKADLLIEAGDPARVLCSAAARVKADVMVIGRGSASGVFGRLRTNAYAIIRESPCPVVSV
jgi:nucleotide-binding universal stress UspA family protein